MPKKKKKIVQPKKEKKVKKTTKQKDKKSVVKSFEADDFSLSKNFIIISAFILVGFFVFLGWQLVVVKKTHFVSLLPKEETVFALEMKIDNRFSKSALFKQWILKNVFSEEKLSNIPKENLSWFFSRNYDLGISKIGESWMIGISPIDFSKTEIVNSIIKYKTKNISAGNNIFEFEVQDSVFYSTSLDNFILISTDKSLLSKLIDNKKTKTSSLSYQSLALQIPYRQYFQAVNLIYLKPNMFFSEAFQNMKFESEVSIADIFGNGIDLPNLVGQLDIMSNNKIRAQFRDMEIPSIKKDMPLKKLMFKDDEERHNYKCKTSDIVSFSGTDLSSKWKDTNTQLINFDYSTLQNLAYKFIGDLYEKTEFDLESDLIFKLDKFYCLGLLEGENVNENKYNFIFEKPKNDFDLKDFMKKAETAFIRFAPFTKPKLRNYVLEDGTMASEWIINMDENIERTEVVFEGVKINTTSFTENYPHTFNVAIFNDLVLISNNFDEIKNTISFYRTEQDDEEIILERTKVFTKNFILDDRYLGKFFDEEFYKNVSNFVEDLKVIDIKKKVGNIYEIDLEL